MSERSNTTHFFICKFRFPSSSPIYQCGRPLPLATGRTSCGSARRCESSAPSSPSPPRRPRSSRARSLAVCSFNHRQAQRSAMGEQKVPPLRGPSHLAESAASASTARRCSVRCRRCHHHRSVRCRRRCASRRASRSAVVARRRRRCHLRSSSCGSSWRCHAFLPPRCCRGTPPLGDRTTKSRSARRCSAAPCWCRPRPR